MKWAVHEEGISLEASVLIAWRKLGILILIVVLVAQSLYPYCGSLGAFISLVTSSPTSKIHWCLLTAFFKS